MWLVVSSLVLSSVPASEASSQKFSSAHVRVSVEQVLTVLDQYYVYPKIAEKMRDHVTNKVELGDYDGARSPMVLIELLQSDLREASQDGHISLQLVTPKVDRTSHIQPSKKNDLKIYSDSFAHSAGVEIAYLALNKFSDGPNTRERLSEAMRSFTTSDALIIDLRDNIGGDPNLVALLSSYFVDSGTLLWSILDRNGDSVIDVRSSGVTQQYKGDVCVLISKTTYSAAEAFTYTLKHLDRACVIGEPSGGGAHLVTMKSVNDEIDIRIPIARAYNPITKSNWEGDGVIPTIEVESRLAKEAAIKHLSNRME